MNCEKIRHSTKEEAKSEIKKLKQKKGFKKMRHYSCGICGGYHLTRLKGGSIEKVRSMIDEFKVGQVWSARQNNKNKFVILSLPSNADGLGVILGECYLSGMDNR